MATYTKQIDMEVEDVLTRCEYDGMIVRMPQLSRALYVKVNDILNLLGGAWNKKLKGHVFPEDPQELIQSALMAGEVMDFKKLYQFYETPAELAKRMVEFACITSGDTVLEPSAGHGAIIRELRRAAKVKVFACEVDEAKRAVVEKEFPEGVFWLGTDFMKVTGNMVFRAIVMNPPFRNGQDVEHVMHAYQMLANGGRLVAVTSPGWTFRTDMRHLMFRNFVNAQMMMGAAEVIPLEAGTFKASGTNVNAKLVILRK